MNNKGILYVISAPSGCGKGTILSEVMKSFKDIHYSVSATTRAPRDGEKNGINYYFISREEFEREIACGGMLEYAEFCDNYYGTPKAKVLEKLDAGIDVILEIETVGAMKVKKAYPDAVLIFILPPNIEALRERLIGRGTETLDVIDKRVGEAASEIEKAHNYDYVMVNDNLLDAIERLENIMKSCKYMTKFNSNTIKGVLN